MTAVVGLLNKHGVALAADSAVTRNSSSNEKITKNGNKILRLSNVIPVSVMLTGNDYYIGNLWNLVVKHYRKYRGDVVHATVEACMHDFFSHIATSQIFWDDSYIKSWVRCSFEEVFNEAYGSLDWEIKIVKDNGLFAKPKAVVGALVKELSEMRKFAVNSGIGPQFQDYTLEQFKEYVESVLDEYIKELSEEDEENPFKTIYPIDFLDRIKDQLVLTTMAVLTSRKKGDSAATLVFSGYGAEQDYPSLVSANVYEGLDHRVNYHVRPEDIVCISDDKPVAFCPFAQSDVIRGIFRELHKDFGHAVTFYTKKFYTSVADILFPEKMYDSEFLSMLSEVKKDDLVKKFIKNTRRQLDKNQHEWEKVLETYDVRQMADLAESLIDLTGFQRILTFSDEGVGGPVDVAVITKNEGFNWINHKRWYENN